MKIDSRSLQNLIEYIDRAADSLISRVTHQEEEINNLKLENQKLRDLHVHTLAEIKQYVVQLEQIKSQYVNSNNNVK